VRRHGRLSPDVTHLTGFQGHTVNQDMLKLLSRDLWSIVRAKAIKAKRRRVAMAYVTDVSLLPLAQGDVLVVDASDASIAGGRTSASVLAEYFSAGVSLFCVRNLHAKVLVLDGCAVIGSANASRRSAEYYAEAAVLSDRPELVGQAALLISSLAGSGEVIDREFIARIQRIDVVPSAGPRPSTASSTLGGVSLDGAKHWFVSTRLDAKYPGDVDVVENANEQVQEEIGANAGLVDWFWWGGTASFPSTAREGDVVIQCTRPKSIMSSARGVWVYRHGVIEKILQEQGQKVKTFHCVYPSNCEETALKWRDFELLAKRAGITRKLGYTSNVRLNERQSAALFDIWPE
jgi:hypothetical protein